MSNFVQNLFDGSDFMPRWNCGDWSLFHGWLHIASDLGTFSAYMAIPIVLAYFIVRRTDFPFPRIVWLFCAFIFACGTVHLFEAIIFWIPFYRLSGLLKVFTALVSWATVMALIPLTPKLLAMRSPRELEREIHERKRAEQALREIQDQLEELVAKRTEELHQANTSLKEEIHERRLAEDALRLVQQELEERVDQRTAELTRINARYRTLIEQIPAVTFMAEIKEENYDLYVSPQIEALLGFKQEEWVANPMLWHSQLHPDDRDRWHDEFALTCSLAEPFRSEYRLISKHGQVVWVHGEARVVQDEDGRPLFLQGVAFDITEQKQAQDKIHGLLESAPDAMVIVDCEGRIVLVNEQTERIFGYAKEELLGQFVEMLIPERYRSEHPQHRNRFFSDPHTRPMGMGMELYGLHKTGAEFPVEISLSPLETAEGVLVSSAIRDITERKLIEEKLLASLREKEILLKEVHHRVKNNLQVVSSLLRLQRGYLTDTKAVTMFDESQNRVHSMALIHESLYRSKNLARIDLNQYANDLARNLVQSYQDLGNRIKLRTEIEQVHLGVDAALPCGLILNELVSNCLKHAFPNNEVGEIYIEFHSESNNRYCLSVCDDGVGFPDGWDFQNIESLGMRIMRILASQLGGALQFRRDDRHTIGTLLFSEQRN